jgi:hypothetical protein
MRLNEGVLLLLKLSADLEQLGKDTSAAWFRQQADELQRGMDRRRRLEACRSIIHALESGPGRIPDLYFAHRDGSPDAARTEEYRDNFWAVRRFVGEPRYPGFASKRSGVRNPLASHVAPRGSTAQPSWRDVFTPYSHPFFLKMTYISAAVAAISPMAMG